MDRIEPSERMDRIDLREHRLRILLRASSELSTVAMSPVYHSDDGMRRKRGGVVESIVVGRAHAGQRRYWTLVSEAGYWTLKKPSVGKNEQVIGAAAASG